MRRALIGDERNDEGMFRWAGWSVSPSNATAATKELAKEVSNLSHDEDFVADTLAQWKVAVARGQRQRSDTPGGCGCSKL